MTQLANERHDNERYDVAIVGAGPAGLSAALLLGRCRRRVLLVDDTAAHGAPRHHTTVRDRFGTDALRRIGVEQLRSLTVTLVQAHVARASSSDDGFTLTSNDQTWRSRKLLVATGIPDRDPPVRGLEEWLGRSVFFCPHCDGARVRDRRLGGLVSQAAAIEYGLALLTWSADVALFTNGTQLEPGARHDLQSQGIRVYEGRIDAAVADERGLRGLRLQDGPTVALDALFVHADEHQHLGLVQQLGCELRAHENARPHRGQRRQIPGLYFTDDAVEHLESMVIAAAAGYQAGLAIHIDLRREEHA